MAGYVWNITTNQCAQNGAVKACLSNCFLNTTDSECYNLTNYKLTSQSSSNSQNCRKYTLTSDTSTSIYVLYYERFSNATLVESTSKCCESGYYYDDASLSCVQFTSNCNNGDEFNKICTNCTEKYVLNVNTHSCLSRSSYESTYSNIANCFKGQAQENSTYFKC